MKKKTKVKIEARYTPWIVLAILFVVAAVLLLPTKIVQYNVEIPYITLEEYTIQEPYEDIEEYVERVSYETTEEYVENVPVEAREVVCTQKTAQYEINISAVIGIIFKNLIVDCNIANYENEALTFRYTIIAGSTPLTEQNALYRFSSSTVIGARTESKVQATFQNVGFDPISYNCLVTPPSFSDCKEETVTKYKPVVKTRPVTKYRDETKYRKITSIRSVTREREVQKIRVEQRSKEINWLFDFNAIIKFRSMPAPVVISEG